MCTATYAVTMAELKEPAHNTFWYGSPLQLSTSRASHAGVDSSVLSPHSTSPHSGRPRQGAWGSVDHHASQYPPYATNQHRYSQDDTASNDNPYDQRGPPALTSHSSLASLKRPYSATEQPPYQEIVQDLRGDDSSKPGVGLDHKLLSFRKAPDKHTIVDSRGHIQQLELTAQLHGMFFLSEMPATSSDGSVLQPELTCYRRNLFQVSGSLITPRSQMSVITEAGESVAVQSTEVTISAVESVDGHPVRLIVIPWKTPPPNSPEVNQQPDQEPSSLPLIPFQDDGVEAEGEFAVYPIGWRRLQFRIATANNGRRKELQQHFVVHLKVMGSLSNGTKVVLSEVTTAPIVVRGRSPRNFQARKEIPLLGSSAGSRGQALVETGLGIVAGSLSIKPQEVKARPLTMEIPRTAFTFSAPKLPASPMTTSLRSNSFPTLWTPATNIASDPYQKLPLSSSTFSAEPAEMQSHLPSSMAPMQLPMVSTVHSSSHVPPIRTQYASYVHSHHGGGPAASSSANTANGPSIPRYMDDTNPRPTKSPRHPSHPSISTESSEYRYAYGTSSADTTISPGTSNSHPSAYPSTSGAHEVASSTAASSSSAPPPPRDYFPSVSSWTTPAGESSAPTHTNGDHRSSYSFGGAGDPYKTSGAVKGDAHGPPAPVYPGQTMSHYSWNTS